MKSGGEKLLAKGTKMMKQAQGFKFPKPTRFKMATGRRLLAGRPKTKGR